MNANDTIFPSRNRDVYAKLNSLAQRHAIEWFLCSGRVENMHIPPVECASLAGCELASRAIEQRPSLQREQAGLRGAYVAAFLTHLRTRWHIRIAPISPVAIPIIAQATVELIERRT